MHKAWLSINKTGMPLEVMRTAPVIHCAVTHGIGPPGVENGHPAMTKGAGCITIGCPLTSTLGLGDVGCAWPACAHKTVAPICSKNPGISIFTI